LAVGMSELFASLASDLGNTALSLAERNNTNSPTLAVLFFFDITAE